MATIPTGFRPITKAEPADIQDRLTIVERVYHQQYGQSPVSHESRYSVRLKTHEQPYLRYATASEEWKPLDCGWLKGAAGMMVISNEAGKNTQVNLTDDEKKAVAAQVLEVLHDGDKYPMIIQPKESIRIRTDNDDLLIIRCRKGTVRYSLFALAR